MELRTPSILGRLAAATLVIGSTRGDTGIKSVVENDPTIVRKSCWMCYR